jgi:hypothetical protein
MALAGGDEMQTHNDGQTTLINLKPGSCRWPLGRLLDRVEFFCGEPAITGCPYCLEHRQRAFTQGMQPKPKHSTSAHQPTKRSG